MTDKGVEQNPIDSSLLLYIEEYRIGQISFVNLTSSEPEESGGKILAIAEKLCGMNLTRQAMDNH